MCSMRRSHLFRLFARAVSVFVLVVFLVPTQGWAEIDHIDGGEGQEGDPTDGHDVHRGGGGSGGLTEPSVNSNDNDVSLVGISWCTPIVHFDGRRVFVWFCHIPVDIQTVSIPGGSK